MDSLLTHPTVIHDVESLLRVKGVGPKIAEMVSASLFDRSSAFEEEAGTSDKAADRAVVGSTVTEGNRPGPHRKTDLQRKEYVPRLGSANYAFLVVLYREQHGKLPHLTKKELMDLAEASGLSSRPIHSRGAGSARFHGSHGSHGSQGSQATRSFYNGWSNFKALVNNGLVQTRGSPLKVSLTEAGAALARRLTFLISPTADSDGHVKEFSLALESPNDLIESATTRHVVCNAGGIAGEVERDFDGAIDNISRRERDSGVEIVLLVDSREQYARSIADKLPGVEIRALPIGDAMWVARVPVGDSRGNMMADPSPTPGARGLEEYVLDHIIERKSIEDLLHSVKDGSRYHSQKYRLKQCGIRHLYYLVEGDIESLSSSTDYKLVSSACAKTSVIDGFNVLRPKSFAETLATFTRMTRSIRKCVGNAILDDSRAKSLGLMTFSEFQARCARLEKESNCVRDVWSVMLNEVPGLGKVAVERRIFSDHRHQTCYGFYSTSGRDSSQPSGSSSRSKKVEDRVLASLFYA